MKPIVVIPTYNERANIEDLILALFSLHLENLAVVVIDDNSPDNTAEIVEGLKAKHNVYLIKRNRKLGLGSAYVTGFKKAIALGATHIFEMDADFSHDPADVPRLLDATKDNDLSIGSRRIPEGKIVGWNMWRHFTSTSATWASRFFLKLYTKDVTAGFRCFRREALEKINFETVKSNGYAFQEELLFRIEQANLSIKEIPVIFNDRRHGKSKLSRKDIIEFFVTILRLRKQLK
jgi:dolichol-phosphate mannosyltransferase